MNKQTTIIVVAVVLIIASFFGGMTYGKSQTINSRGNFATFGAGTAGRTTRNGVGAGGNFAGGQVIAKDSTSITVSVPSGGSRIVFVAPSTPVLKSVSGTLNDVTVGEQVTVSGTTNSDGSITATSIQIRPATTTPGR